LRISAIAYSGMGVFSVMAYLSPNYYVAFALLALTATGGSVALAPLFATIQTLVPERMRATAIALIYLCSNLIGGGLGPFVTGAMSDVLHALVGEESLRYSLVVLCPGYLWGGWHLWRASSRVRYDLAAQNSGPQGGGLAEFDHTGGTHVEIEWSDRRRVSSGSEHTS